VIRLTQLAVSKRSVTVLITLAMLLGGVFAWASLKQELLPNIAFPYVVVITPVPGASAQDVAVAVTEPVERLHRQPAGVAAHRLELGEQPLHRCGLVRLRDRRQRDHGDDRCERQGPWSDRRVHGGVVRHQRPAAAHGGDTGDRQHGPRPNWTPWRGPRSCRRSRASMGSARST